jgi:uncharacterized protein (DUF2147 family)
MIDLKVPLPRLAALVLAAAAPAAAGEADPTGLWYDHSGRGVVEITRCGAELCGRLVWLKDRENEQACGRQIIGGLKRMANAAWDNGWIWDPERDAKYDVAITPMGSNALKVVGYAGTKLFSETMVWRRAPDTLTRCDKPHAAAGPAAASEAAPAATTAAASATPSANPEPAPAAGRALADAPEARTCQLRLPYLVVTFSCSE